MFWNIANIEQDTLFNYALMQVEYFNTVKASGPHCFLETQVKTVCMGKTLRKRTPKHVLRKSA